MFGEGKKRCSFLSFFSGLQPLNCETNEGGYFWLGDQLGNIRYRFQEEEGSKWCIFPVDLFIFFRRWDVNQFLLSLVKKICTIVPNTVPIYILQTLNNVEMIKVKHCNLLEVCLWWCFNATLVEFVEKNTRTVAFSENSYSTNMGDLRLTWFLRIVCLEQTMGA